MHSTVFIDQLALDTYIGLHQWEMTDRQTVITNIRMELDISKAAQTDEVAHSIDYEFVAKHLRTWAYNHRCKLLEKLALEVITQLTTYCPTVQKITVRLTKVGVVEHTAGCGVEVTFTR